MKKEILGTITIYTADCMDVMRQYPDGYFDLAIVDPPYFDGPQKLGYYGAEVTKSGVRRGGYARKHWDVPGADYFSELFRVSKQQIIWGCNYYQFPFGPGRIVWDKVNATTSFSDCELAYCSLIDTVRKFTFMWNGMLQGKSITEGHIQQGNKKLNEKRIHPTQKPVALYKWVLSQFAKEGYKILDTHFGSGSHGIACHDLDFELVAVDIDADCTATAAKRIKAHQAQTNLFADSLTSSRTGFFMDQVPAPTFAEVNHTPDAITAHACHHGIDLGARMLSVEEIMTPTEYPPCQQFAKSSNPQK